MSFRRHLVRWEREFSESGLVIVEVSGGRDIPLDVARERLSKWHIRHAVLWDKDNRNSKAYALSGWPSAYLIGADGKVFWQGNPGTMAGRKDDEETLRKAIRTHLDKSKRGDK